MTPQDIYGLAWSYYLGTNGKEQNYQKAYELYVKAAVMGHVNAIVFVGYMLYRGKGVERDCREAFRWFRLAAEQDNPMGQFQLAEMLANGEGIEQNYEEAFKWCRRAAEQGHSQAQYELGRMYKSGKGVEKDLLESKKWYELAASQGNKNAQYSLGLVYCYDHDEDGVKQDFNEAAKWFRLAAEQGHREAQYELGRMYRARKGLERDLKEAAKWFRLAAEQGHSQAQYELGRAYRHGWMHFEPDLKESAKWFRLSAEQGYAVAQHDMGEIYRRGLGVKRDYTEAAKWYKLSATQNISESMYSSDMRWRSHIARSRYLLGYMYEAGYGVEKNIEKAFFWYQSSADESNLDAMRRIAQERYKKAEYKEAYQLYEKAGCDASLVNMAEMRISGLGCEKSMDKAISLLLNAAEDYFEEDDGNQLAMNKLSQIYIGEYGTEVNLNEYVRYLTRCKDIRSQLKLAELYCCGIHVEQDTYKAVRIWQDIARQGYKCAHYNLAIAYYYGIGTDMDKALALYYLNEVKDYDYNACQLLSALTEPKLPSSKPAFRQELKQADIKEGSILEAEWKYINIRSPHINEKFNEQIREIIDIYKAKPSKESYFWLSRLYRELRFENNDALSEVYFDKAVDAGHLYAKYIKDIHKSKDDFSDYNLYFPYSLRDILIYYSNVKITSKDICWTAIHIVCKTLQESINKNDSYEHFDKLLSNVKFNAEHDISRMMVNQEEHLYDTLSLCNKDTLQKEFIEYLWDIVAQGRRDTLSFPNEAFYAKLNQALQDSNVIILDGVPQFNAFRYLDKSKRYIGYENHMWVSDCSIERKEIDDILELIQFLSGVNNFQNGYRLNNLDADTIVTIPYLANGNNIEHNLCLSEKCMIYACEESHHFGAKKSIILVNQEFCSSTKSKLAYARAELFDYHQIETVISLGKNIFKDVQSNTYLLILNREEKCNEVTFITDDSEIVVPYSDIESNEYILNPHIYQEICNQSDEMETVRLCDLIEAQPTDGPSENQQQKYITAEDDLHGSLLTAVSRRNQGRTTLGSRNIVFRNYVYTGEYIFLRYDNGTKIHIQDQGVSSIIRSDIHALKIKEDSPVTLEYLAYILLSADIQAYMKDIVDHNGNFMFSDLLYKKVSIHKDKAIQRSIVEEALIKERQRFGSGVEYNAVIFSDNPRVIDAFNKEENIAILGKDLTLENIFDKYIKDTDQSIIDAIVADAEHPEYDNVLEDFAEIRKSNIHIYLISKESTVKGRKKSEYFTGGNRMFDADEEFQKALINKLRDDLDSSNSYQAKIRMKHKDVFEAADCLDKKHGLNISKVIMRYIQNGYVIDYAENTPFDQLRTICHKLINILASEYGLLPSTLKEGAVASLLADGSYTDKSNRDKQYVILHPIMDRHLAKSLEYFCYIANKTIHGNQDSSKLGTAALNILMEFILWFYDEDIVQDRLSVLKGNGRMLFTDDNDILDEFISKEYEVKCNEKGDYLYIDDTHIAGVGIHVQQNKKSLLKSGSRIRITKRIGFEKEIQTIGQTSISFYVKAENYEMIVT